MAIETEQAMQEPSTSVVLHIGDSRFTSLRGVRWRVNLGILPSSPSSSIDDLRRVTADSRRRYAALRRRLLVDPHLLKDGSNSPDLAIDNPLSQNPESTWGRFFRNAELEKTLDQDLSRLYPEHESYFQSHACQGMLRRILLLWCLRHPEFGYRQGMHELLAPLLYVLHADVEHLSEVRKTYEDHFTDRFDDLAFQENDATYNFDFKKFLDSMEDDVDPQESSKKPKSLDELDPETQTIVLLSDAYGAEGELGIILSEKFMEHDAYSMFDALMSGAHGSIAVSDFFSHAPPSMSLTGLPPVIEAATALYHLLSTVDSSLYSHLVELGVEPQYFALRWLRVLFGREFSLENLLIVWDEIFSAENSKPEKSDRSDLGSGFRILSSPRGALISGIAVSMILFLRSSLLGTENATSALQRLLNFPENIDLRKILEKAKSLQALALDINTSNPSLTNEDYNYCSSKPKVVKGHSLSVDSISLKSPVVVVPESYWEEKWRDLHKAEELKQTSLEKHNPARKKGWSERVRLRLSRTESDPPPDKVEKGKKVNKLSVRRSLLEDLSQQLASEETEEKAQLASEETEEKADFPEIPSQNYNNGNYRVDDVGPSILSQSGYDSEGIDEINQAGDNTKEFSFAGEEGSCASVAGEEQSSILSDTTSPHRFGNYQENDSEKSSVASNLSRGDSNDAEEKSVNSPLPVSQSSGNESSEIQCKSDLREESVAVLKEKKLLPGKFQWLRKFGRNASGEETSDRKGSNVNNAKATVNGSVKSDMACSSTDGCIRGLSGCKDQNVKGALRNLGQSMLEHIQAIESVFQQDRDDADSLNNLCKTGLVDTGQGTAMTALKELRKIGNLLSEM